VPARAEDPVIDLFLQAVDTYQGQEAEQIRALLSPDVILWMSGTSFLAGQRRGWEEVLGFVRDSAGVIDLQTIQLEDIAAEEQEVRATMTVDLVASGSERLRVRMLPRVHFDSEGRVLDVWVEAEDQEAFDRFLGAEGGTRDRARAPGPS
jgi:hypothetical protein